MQPKPEDHIEIIKSVVRSRCKHMFIYFDFDDLVAMGYFGLAGACERFKQKKGVKFITYASICIYGSIIDEIRSNNWFKGDKRCNHTVSPVLIDEIKVVIVASKEAIGVDCRTSRWSRSWARSRLGRWRRRIWVR